MRKYLLMLGLGLGLANVCCKSQEPQSVFTGVGGVNQLESVGGVNQLELDILDLSLFGVIKDDGVAVFYDADTANKYHISDDGLHTGTLVKFNDSNHVSEYVMQRRAGKRPRVEAIDLASRVRAFKPKDFDRYARTEAELAAEKKKLEALRNSEFWEFPYFLSFDGEKSPIPESEYAK